jgi:hypothetical protein
MEYPNSGSLFPSVVRKSDKSPDFWGSIKIDRAYLEDLIGRSGDSVEIKLSGWKREAKATGNKFLSITVDTYVNPNAAAPAPKQEEKDPWA